MTTKDLVQLTSAPPSIQRDETLVKLLGRLQKEDRLFEYNVPPNIRASYDNEALFAHLQRTYSQPVFVVEEPSEMKKYIRAGDGVIKKGDGELEEVVLAKGTKGFVLSSETVQGKEKVVKVNFNTYGPKIVALADLEVYGEQGFFRDKVFKKAVPALEMPNGLEYGHYVTFIGEDSKEVVARVPDGTPGLVANPFEPDKGHNPYLIWVQRPGLVQKFLWWKDNWSTAPKAFWSYNEFKLAIPNYLNLENLLNEIRGPQ